MILQKQQLFCMFLLFWVNVSCSVQKSSIACMHTLGYPENTESCCGSLHRWYVLRIHIVRMTRGFKGPNSEDNLCHKPDFWRGEKYQFLFIKVEKKGWKTWFSVYVGQKPLKKPFLDRFWCSLDLCPLIQGWETRFWWENRVISTQT